MSNKSIDKMAAQFNSLEELQAYCDAQYKTILTLNAKLQLSEKELEDLRDQIAVLKHEQLLNNAKQSSSNQFATSDEETACVIQIAMLKEHSLVRELTMDETKKLDTFVRVLQSIRNKQPAKKEASLEDLPTEDLMLMRDAIKTEQ
jgi:hypothetical protein